MQPWLAATANPHSPSPDGRKAAAAIEVARAQLTRTLGLPAGQFLFTSGATEALNWALKGVFEAAAFRGKLVTVATEHAAVFDTAAWLEGRGVEVVRLPVGADGLVDLDVAAAAMTGATLVAAMLVNNEIGVIQPVAELADMAHAVGALFLCDAVQGFGRLAIPENVDMVAISAHKIHGPKGVGGLWVREGVTLPPLLHGGGQEQGLRSGTLSPALCVGFGTAAALSAERFDLDAAHVRALQASALACLGSGWIVNGSLDHRYAGNLNLRRPGLDGGRLLADSRDMAFSLGSACASGSGRPSHVLKAIGLSPAETRNSIRIGFGRYTTEEEIEIACDLLNQRADSQRLSG